MSEEHELSAAVNDLSRGKALDLLSSRSCPADTKAGGGAMAGCNGRARSRKRDGCQQTKKNWQQKVRRHVHRRESCKTGMERSQFAQAEPFD